ncbi:MAG: tyrosine-type recombinase/integrase [Acidithiobacillus ferrooxidans]|uniref:tyrosine-type recombinase/integrase n=1 Tax=Acidithiobacillus ferrooxidans TaxID=920 RepID=UPI0027D7716F|nr:tyrosine-type recombinase/integrase [Acidithiobacillus ferrooxidans]
MEVHERRHAGQLHESHEESRNRGLTFHDLRHEATSRLCEKGIPVMTVQAITWHKSTQMRRYTHISGKVLVDAVRRVDAVRG